MGPSWPRLSTFFGGGGGGGGGDLLGGIPSVTKRLKENTAAAAANATHAYFSCSILFIVVFSVPSGIAPPPPLPPSLSPNQCLSCDFLWWCLLLRSLLYSRLLWCCLLLFAAAAAAAGFDSFARDLWVVMFDGLYGTDEIFTRSDGPIVPPAAAAAPEKNHLQPYCCLLLAHPLTNFLPKLSSSIIVMFLQDFR